MSKASKGDRTGGFRPRAGTLRLYQAAVFASLMLLWYVLTETSLLPKFFFGEPLLVARRIWEWLSSGQIYRHIGITLTETLLAFALGSVLALAIGLWLAFNPIASPPGD